MSLLLLKGYRNLVSNKKMDISDMLANKEYEEKEGTQDFTLEGSVAPFWKMEQPA